MLVVVAALLISAAIYALSIAERAPSIQIPTSVVSGEDASLGLILGLHISTNATGALLISTNETNILSRVNNVTTANDWPLPDINSYPCGNYNQFPIQYAVFQGRYELSNYSSGVSLTLFNPAEIYSCPTESNPGPYLLFAPLSDNASYRFPSGGLGSYPVSAMYSLSGYWTGSQSGSAFHHFSSGFYTVLVENEWGDVVLLHFEVGSTGTLVQTVGAHNTVSVSGLGLCATNCGYPAPYSSALVTFNGSIPVSSLAVYVNNIEWQESDTLAGLGPKDRDYITQTADDDTTSVIFGNGVQGARLPTGSSNITAIYRNGIGQAGNVDANQISLLQSRPLNVKSVVNPLRASGGADRDSRDQARSNAPLAVMSLDRLVSVHDYADFARSFAGIGKASSAKLSDGQRDLVHVTIAGAEDIPIDPTSDLYANLVQALHVNGDPYEPLQVAVRNLRLLVISAQVKILDEYLWEDVAADLRAALLNVFSFDNRSLGQPVFQSEVISAMQAVAGVAYVSLQILDSVVESASAAAIANLASTLALNDFIPAALARRNPSPVNYPTDAILPAEMVYLTPTLPDTLILNQVKS